MIRWVRIQRTSTQVMNKLETPPEPVSSHMQSSSKSPNPSPDPDIDDASSKRQATRWSALKLFYVNWPILTFAPFRRVFKKSSANGKITVYLGKRDFVDHITHVDPIGEFRLIVKGKSCKLRTRYVRFVWHLFPLFVGLWLSLSLFVCLDWSIFDLIVASTNTHVLLRVIQRASIFDSFLWRCLHGDKFIKIDIFVGRHSVVFGACLSISLRTRQN